MKNLKTLSIIFLLILVGCSKSDTNTDTSNDRYRIASYTTSSGKTIYEYDSNNNITKITAPNRTQTFTYNAQNQITSAYYTNNQQNIVQESYLYDTNGILKDYQSIQNNKVAYRYEYVNDGQKITTYKYYSQFGNSAPGVLTLVDDYTIVYNANKQISEVRDVYSTTYVYKTRYEYNTNGNLVASIKYDASAGANLAIIEKNQWTYDDKMNLFTNLYPHFVVSPEGKLKNNILTKRREEFNSSGVSTLLVIENNSYTYNASGYVVQWKTSPTSSTDFVLEKY